MDKKSVLLVLVGYLIWGVHAFYWNLMGHIDSMFTMAFRILWAVAFTVFMLAITKRLPELKAVFQDRQKMKFLAPAALFLFFDWAIFIYAVQNGHVIDVSLGYYMGPFVVFGIGMVVFREKPGKLAIVAILLAIAGVVISFVQFGNLPLLALVLASLFSIYGMLKRFAQVDGLISIAAETIMMSPVAVLYLLFFRAPDIVALRAVDHLLLIGAGIVTALPMILYSMGVLKIPFLTLGFMQYISPTLGLFCGLLLGETITQDKLVTFVFIWGGLALYMFSMVRDERRRKKENKAEEAANAVVPEGSAE